MTALPLPSPSWAYFLDLDGTLAEIAPTPDAVRLSPRVLSVVRALATRSAGAVAIVSGRSVADVDQIFGDPSLTVSGQHGLEWRAESCALPAVHAPVALDDVRARLAAMAECHPAILVEDKRISLAVHYRRDPGLSAMVERTMRRELDQLGTGYRLQQGKCVLELRPVGGGKGHAIAALMTQPPFRGRTPVFIGDDETDEDGFLAINDAGGLSIHVGNGPTAARWTLPSPAAVIDWLATI